ncbi:unnamed protein product [Lymnaea stagnalis]|uniref:SMP-LTD domain-containing protein n=1 Tax=Lymnaea stagnalis TaxID=6523 RepID=A0AAV2HAK3_LYMST
MNSKKSVIKPDRPPPPSNAARGSLSLSGFSFKQLEDQDEEDLTAFTGKYEKIIEESQKVGKKVQERTPSTSSISSTSSVPGESKFPEKCSSEPIVDSQKSTLKSLPLESTNSPLRNAARAKLESSKELFSGLKGKITDKISRTIEEFSGDSSNSPSPDKERPKSFPLPRSNSFGPVEKENINLLHSAPPEKELPSPGQEKDMAIANEIIVSSLPLNSLSPKEMLVSSSEAGGLFPEESISIVDHPLAHTDGDDGFEDVIEPHVVDPKKNKLSLNEDGCEFHDAHLEEVKDIHSKIEVLEEYFTSEPSEDFTGFPGFSTSTQLKPRSKLHRLIKKKEPKTSAVATMSGLHYTPDEEIADPFEARLSNEIKEQHQDLPQEEKKSSSNLIESKSSKLLRHLSLDSLPVLPYQKLATVIIVIFAYLIVPLPTYVSGFLMGALLTSSGWGIYLWLMQPPSPQEPYVPQPVTEAPFPEMKVTNEADEGIYKGWMNELTDYNENDYHINKTHSVFICLEGVHLRMQRPRNPIPKRAMFDEILPIPAWIHQRHFDLPGSTVYLLPNGLVKKRIWSKKYPICISLPNTKQSSDNTNKIKHISSDPLMGSRKKGKQTDMGFLLVSEEKCEHNVLFLFARTGREKEEWFKRFTAAANGTPLGNHILELRRVLSQSLTTVKKNTDAVPRTKREGSTESVGSVSSLADALEDPDVQKENSVSFLSQHQNLLDFAHYMGRLMPAGTFTKEFNKNATGKETDDNKPVSPPGSIQCDSQLYWVNALIGRCFFDFLRDKWWIDKVKQKLQRKLSKIHVPYFIEELKVTKINLGNEMPAIEHAGKPYLDERGLWIEMDVQYTGGFTMTIETKMNLMKLKTSSQTSSTTEHSVAYHSPKRQIKSLEMEKKLTLSHLPSHLQCQHNFFLSSSGGGTSRKLLRYLNKITQSKYFHKATEYGVIKRAMENVSNTPLTLTVTLIKLNGKLALNIPPPPSNRLWYGFRQNPTLILKANPQVGERQVTITHITEWIEKKLTIEFQRVFVMPNMDDLVIPILVPGPINGATISHSVSL